MNNFTLLLQDCSHSLQIEQISSFVATDASGSFGIQAGHETLLTCLQPGLARYKTGDGNWQYIAQPGALLWFQDNHLHLITSQFITSADRNSLLPFLDTHWQQENENRRTNLRNITQMEQALARKIREMNQRSESL